VVRSRTQLVWVLVACAAVVAQIVPKAPCQACDKPCCAGQARDHGSTTADFGDDRASGCPLCAAAADRSASEPHRQPCHCNLTARHDQPLALTRVTLPAVSDGSVAIGLPAAPPVVSQALGVSREYVAELLGVPIRPLRILFGVWRN